MIKTVTKKDMERLLKANNFHCLEMPMHSEKEMMYFEHHYPEHFFVLEENGQLIGYVYGYIIDQLASYDHQGNNWLLICGLGCLDDHRDQEITLIYHMLDHASSLQLHGCMMIAKKDEQPDLKQYGFRLCQYPLINKQGWLIYQFAFHRIHLTRLSRYISFVLRHHPEEIGASVDQHGWMSVDELMAGFRKKGRYLNIDLLNKIVAEDEKQRYHFNDDHSMIRAAQGHSIAVDVEMTEKQPPALLYHGTSLKNYEMIQKTGIKKMKRLYVHLSKDVVTAKKVGSRHGQPVVLVIDSKKMYEDGCRFYLSANEIWLCDDIDCRYIVDTVF